MTDLQIKQYLLENNYIVPAEDGIYKILNTSPQIQSVNYDLDTKNLTIITLENKFTFRWELKKYKGESKNEN